MADVYSVTQSTRSGIARATNSADTSFPSRVPTITKPSGDGILAGVGGDGGGIAPINVKLVPFGVGSDTQTFSMAVLLWDEVPSGVQGEVSLWVPNLLCTFTGCTLSSSYPGIANTRVGSSNLFCNAITLGVGNAGVGVEVISPTTNPGVAHAVVMIKGGRLVEVIFDMTGATSANCLYTVL